MLFTSFPNYRKRKIIKPIEPLIRNAKRIRLAKDESLLIGIPDSVALGRSTEMNHAIYQIHKMLKKTHGVGRVIIYPEDLMDVEIIKTPEEKTE